MLRRKKKQPERKPTLPSNTRRSQTSENSRTPSRKNSEPSNINSKARVLLRIVARGILSGALTALVFWMGFAIHRHATTADYFRMRSFEVHGNQRLSQEEILRISTLDDTQNIFSLNCSKVESMLEDFPWIFEASVSSRLPSTVTIDIVEHTPFMMVMFDVPYLLNESGSVFKRWAPGDPVPNVVLTGISRDQYNSGEYDVQDSILAAIDLVTRYRAAGLQRLDNLEEIHKELDGGYSLVLGKDPYYVKFGTGPFRRKLTHLGALIRRLKRDNQRPAIIFFDNEVRPDRVTVKLKQSSASNKESQPNNPTEKRLSKI